MSAFPRLKLAAILLCAVLSATLAGSANAQNPGLTNALGKKPVLPIPAEHRTPAKEQGEVVRFDYEIEGTPKYACVYLPHGYDATKRYEIFYIMHGGGDRVETILGAPGEDAPFKNAVDHLIASGEIRPVILVAPTFYRSRDQLGMREAMRDVASFPKELAEVLIPALESKYSTFAESVDERGLTSSRDKRAFGGFSMGAVATWNVFNEYMKHFRTFVPVSGDSWQIRPTGGKETAPLTAAALAEAVAKQGFGKKDFLIYALTGGRDIAEPNMAPMIREMQKLDDVFDDSCLIWRVKEDGKHTIPALQEYLYNVLQDLYGTQKAE